jgi:hypothetical protein
MPPDHARTPTQIIGDLLGGHPEAASLLSEACHYQALARESATFVRHAFTLNQAARLSYEQLWHRIDPRRLRTVDPRAGLLILLLLGAGLAFLDAVEIGGTTFLLPVSATAVWLTGAWMAALASRNDRWPDVVVVAVTGVLFGALLATLHDLNRGSMLFGILIGAFILMLAGGAAALISRMQSVALLAARRRWHRARRAYDAAVQTERDDREAAAVATEAWLVLVRSQASVVTDDGQTVHDTVVMAAALLENGRPQLSAP